MSRQNARSHRQRGGFTLVELLVVVTIISILIALVSTAVADAMTSAREARVLAEIAGIDMAMQNYAADYGVPPDFSPYDGTSWNTAEAGYAQAVFMKHLMKRFPSSTIFVYDAGNPNNVRPGINTAYGLDTDDLDAAEALVFWLGGFSQGGRLIGFNANKGFPLDPGGKRTTPLYDFDETRLLDRDGDGWLEYYPDAETGPPFVYFCSRGNGVYTPGAAYANAAVPAFGFAVPYYKTPTEPINSRSFQIIAGGVSDNTFGAAPASSPLYPSGLQFRDGDNDNLTNFHSGRLEKGLQ